MAEQSSGEYAALVLQSIFGALEDCPVASYTKRLPADSFERREPISRWSEGHRKAAEKIGWSALHGFASRLCPNGWEDLEARVAEGILETCSADQYRKKTEEFVKHLLMSKGRRERHIGQAFLLHVCDGVIDRAVRQGHELTKVTACHRTLARAKLDLERLFEGLPLDDTTRRPRINDKAVQRVLRYILSDRCVRPVSWTTKKVWTSAGPVEVPALMRIDTIAALWRGYEEEVSDEEQFGLTVFSKVLKALTAPNAGVVRSVSYIYFDHVVHVLRANQLLVKRFCPRPQERKRLLCLLDCSTACIKSLARPDEVLCPCHETCAVHNLRYALRLQPSVSAETIGMGTCRMVRNIFQVYSAVEDSIRSSEFDAQEQHRGLATLARSKALTHSYMAHVLRCAWQNEIIAQAMEEVQEDEHTAFCIMDFKQKVEPIIKTEDQRGGFGKKGIPFHGTAMWYRKKWYYFAHAVDKTGVQDVALVISLIEAFLHLLRDQEVFDGVQRVVLQSDQARYYSSSNLLFAIAHLNRINSGLQNGMPQIVRLLHTEPQDGKGIADSFFSTAGGTMKRAVQAGANLTCAEEIVTILHDAAASGALANTSVELLQVDRSWIGPIVDNFKRKRISGVSMDTIFFGDDEDASKSFRFVVHRVAGDIGQEVPVMTTKGTSAKASVPPEPCPRRGFLPFSGAWRSMYAPAVMRTTEKPVSPSRTPAKKVQDGTLFVHCVTQGVQAIQDGTFFTKQNCHRLLDQFFSGAKVPEWGLRAADVTREEEAHCEKVLLHGGKEDPVETAPEVAEDDDGEEGPVDLSEEATLQQMDRMDDEQDLGPDSEEVCELEQFSYGWAARCRRGRGNDESAVLAASIKEKLRMYYREGAGGDHMQPGAAIMRLAEEGVRDDELPAWSQVLSYFSQVHAVAASKAAEQS